TRSSNPSSCKISSPARVSSRTRSTAWATGRRRRKRRSATRPSISGAFRRGAHRRTSARILQLGAVSLRFGFRKLFPLALIAALLTACSTLPDIRPWEALPTAGKTPTVVGARGPLTKQRADAVLARIEAKGGGNDLLARHLAIEEEVAGQPLTIGNSATLL